MEGFQPHGWQSLFRLPYVVDRVTSREMGSRESEEPCCEGSGRSGGQGRRWRWARQLAHPFFLGGGVVVAVMCSAVGFWPLHTKNVTFVGA